MSDKDIVPIVIENCDECVFNYDTVECKVDPVQPNLSVDLRFGNPSEQCPLRKAPILVTLDEKRKVL